jgi:hypothetical protein
MKNEHFEEIKERRKRERIKKKIYIFILLLSAIFSLTMSFWMTPTMLFYGVERKTVYRFILIIIPFNVIIFMYISYQIFKIWDS